MDAPNVTLSQRGLNKRKPTTVGLGRDAEAKTTHGNKTRQLQIERSLASARLAMLEDVGQQLGLTGGTRTCGPKPTRILVAHHELRQAPDMSIESQGNHLILHPTVCRHGIALSAVCSRKQ